MTYRVTKRYGHQEGWGCCFRQHRASHSHCQFLHGYAMAFELTFESEELNDLNWVIDFGGLKQVKAWLQETFDHKTIIAEDDPSLRTFKDMKELGLIDLKILPAVGCEKFAEYIYNSVYMTLKDLTESQIKLVSVKVCEHEGNSATFGPEL